MRKLWNFTPPWRLKMNNDLSSVIVMIIILSLLIFQYSKSLFGKTLQTRSLSVRFMCSALKWELFNLDLVKKVKSYTFLGILRKFSQGYQIMSILSSSSKFPWSWLRSMNLRLLSFQNRTISNLVWKIPLTKSIRSISLNEKDVTSGLAKRKTLKKAAV